jgi:hypothetical protein
MRSVHYQISHEALFLITLSIGSQPFIFYLYIGSQTSMDSQTYSVKDVLEECTKRKIIDIICYRLHPLLISVDQFLNHI